MAYILAFDQGTTSSRALVFDRAGHSIAIAQKEFVQHFPKSGFVEHDAKEIWTTQREMALEAIAKAKLKASDISAIGITNQRETTVVWDRKTSEPIYRAIVWQDRRTAPLCDRLKESESIFREKTGLLLDPYFSGTKLAWILDNVPGARKRAERGELAFGTIDSWLIWMLTNGALHITDVTNASRTLLFNLHTMQWDRELLEILNIPASLLPEVRSCSEVYGKTADGIFPSQIPIGAIAGDQQAALFGQGCYQAGMAKATYGTGCFLLMNLGDRPIVSTQRLLTTVAWKIGGQTTYALEGSVFIAGAAIQWLRDNLGLIEKSSDIDALAASVSDTNGVVFVPAFTGLGAPHWEPHARGAIFGLSRGTSGGHIARATLESIAFSAADVLHAMEKDAGRKIVELRVDGGVSRSDLLLQFQSDLIQSEIIRPNCTELTALGAAMLAGLAVGIWSDPSELSAHLEIERKFKPKMGADEINTRTEMWNRAVKGCASYE